MEEEEEEQEGSGWLVSFADLMTLLFAAFVVLYGITPRGKSDQVVGVSSSIREAFIEIPDEIPEEFRKGEMYKGKITFEEVKRERTFNPAIKKFNRTESILRSRNDDMQRIEVFLDSSSKGRGIQYSLRQATEVSETEFGFSLNLLGRAFFIPGSAALSAKGMEELKSIASQLKGDAIKILVEGHTDETQTGRLSPIELGALRASRVRQVLMEHSKLDPKNIYSTSYGDSRPIASHKTKDGRLKNNRVEIHLIYQDDGRF
ncbi:Flagellar motor protein MotB [Pseudobacteriovorax antillogorgiicola]|uniref:Flagellar motor protein MotB n=1 Tax=Pseudobacteriovorax antillogorgiicola TaxID=1513793 RepID=A0A1Y6CBP0_9BACT|nr:flagellar motor protein MotB [Pseudobacteriovorax antillogorgiicola]SMF46869.1 Flagellar motor protein MotB [Pseudobacteriovorax antillogorgiicola]